MFINAVLIIIIGLLCLVGAVIALIFGVIALANKTQSRFVWVSIFFACLIGLFVCIFSFVTRLVNRVEDFTTNTISNLENYNDSVLNDSTFQETNQYETSLNNSQIKYIKSLSANNSSEPEQFYAYLGYKDYYRFPLRYPYSIHCMFEKENGELYNELNVKRFDENDNGEVFTGIENISSIAFDKKYLLIEQSKTSYRSNKAITHYVLFEFDTEKKEEFSSIKQLFEKAKEKGYVGSDSLLSIKQYADLFN